MHVNLFPSQWSIIVLGDLLIRSGTFFGRSLNVLTIPIALFLSAIHLGLLISVALFVNTFALKARRAIGVTLAATNIMFCFIFISVWLLFIKSGRQTSCVANECSWIDGSITAIGVKTILFETAVQVVINVVPYLFVSALALRRRNPAAKQN
jgi:hypothetical protein